MVIMKIAANKHHKLYIYGSPKNVFNNQYVYFGMFLNLNCHKVLFSPFYIKFGSQRLLWICEII